MVMTAERRSTSTRGPSIIERLWAELDSIMDRLMVEGLPVDPEPRMGTAGLINLAEDYRAWGEERGKAQGVAYALAMMTNPYRPDVESIKAQAVARWEARQ